MDVEPLHEPPQDLQSCAGRTTYVLVLFQDAEAVLQTLQRRVSAIRGRSCHGTAGSSANVNGGTDETNRLTKSDNSRRAWVVGIVLLQRIGSSGR